MSKRKNDDRRQISVKVTPETYRRLIELTARKSASHCRIHFLGEEAGRVLAKALAETPLPPLVEEVVKELA